MGYNDDSEKKAHRMMAVFFLVIDHNNHDKLIEQKGTYYRLYTGAFELD